MSKLNLYEGLFVDGDRLLHLLGSGASGEVWSALTSDKKVVALKIYSGREEALVNANYEYGMATRFTNESILVPLGISSSESHPIIRLPYCEGRSVDGIAACFSEKMIWKLIVEISGALIEIHDKGYAHCDVKPSNILWDGNRFMLSDFGACLNLSNVSSEKTTSDPSSYRFDAPELSTRRCAASDIWSLGATVFFLFMGCHVFNGMGGKAQHQDSPVPFMRKTLPTLSRLVSNCLDFHPEKRPTSKLINEIAQTELIKLNSYSSKRDLRHEAKYRPIPKNAEFWPEQMLETII